MYFAALRCTTNPPSVPLPGTSRLGSPIDLTVDNCPRPFIAFLTVWARTVPLIQQLSPEYQHDLGRIICGLGPLTSPLHPDISRIAAELRAVAIEISQRRTFQNRYAGDLQTALDRDMGEKRVASFVPPPMYEPSPASSPSRSPHMVSSPLPHHSPSNSQSSFLHPTSPVSAGFHASGSRSHSHSRTPSPSAFSPPPSPSFAVDAPALQLIRETLYASLGDVLAKHRYIRRLIVKDPPRAYFASVALAILDVSLSRTSIQPDIGVVVDGVLGTHLTLSQCPRPLQPFMNEIGAIGVAAREAEEEDTQRALQVLSEDAGAELPTPRMERVRRILERGVGSEGRKGLDDTEEATSDDDDDDNEREVRRRQSLEGRAIALANKINALALGMTKLRAFRDRQHEIFKILASIRS